jgi:hypothetical protein
VVHNRYRRPILVMLGVIGVVATAVTASDTKSYVRRYRDVKFQPLNPPMSAGAEAAVLWGDARTGPSALLFKMRKGSTPLHIHSSSYHLAVIGGGDEALGEGRERSRRPRARSRQLLVHRRQCGARRFLSHQRMRGLHQVRRTARRKDRRTGVDRTVTPASFAVLTLPLREALESSRKGRTCHGNNIAGESLGVIS